MLSSWPPGRLKPGLGTIVAAKQASGWDPLGRAPTLLHCFVVAVDRVEELVVGDPMAGFVHQFGVGFSAGAVAFRPSIWEKRALPNQTLSKLRCVRFSQTLC